ncbi:response regulator containing CheY-like receiver, AAA-type ATPase, and DNA-binding domains [Legionella oakridgensis ATCC 33761 = DSM 21215]|uniref:Response regulator containing CheY-like receiver, AAA-type ATPase, and DNA-binding domains n=1 Tax=Legionella oakridgensis ATCC 33761 = DSM 21215 TaxID=1268635 RepID=W0B737_9GAMM|nr:response regulator [Legionella oakridgensis]AHE66353.1 response regulator containing CheY-like receiver, AAA-type ATPase, and DNA-binding domains [Legionella oakridgensis ATCC 33761 = DSM 21215]
MYSLKPVLLIEDDQIDQASVQKAFVQLNIKNDLIIRENGKEGLNYLKEAERPCLIILDLNMPRMNGMEFLDVIKKINFIKISRSLCLPLPVKKGKKSKLMIKGLLVILLNPQVIKKL